MAKMTDAQLAQIMARANKGELTDEDAAQLAETAERSPSATIIVDTRSNRKQ
jgi:hypothetical protein